MVEARVVGDLVLEAGDFLDEIGDVVTVASGGFNEPKRSALLPSDVKGSVVERSYELDLLRPGRIVSILNPPSDLLWALLWDSDFRV